jgi:hypothetical protein
MDVYALTMVMLYCSRRGHQYPFLVAFPLRNLPTLFILNNENDKSLAVFRKMVAASVMLNFLWSVVIPVYLSMIPNILLSNTATNQ